MALVDKTELTELYANPNSVVNSPSEGSIPESSCTENISGELAACGCLTMGASLQPIRGTAEVPPKRGDSYPSSLRSTSTSCSSYSLEISVSTAKTNNTDKESRPMPLKSPLESRADENPLAKPLSSHDHQKPVSLITKSYGSSDSKPVQDKGQLSNSLKVTQCLDKHGTFEIVTPKSPKIEPGLEKTFLSNTSGDGKVGAQPVSTSQPPKASFTQPDRFSTGKQASQEEGDMFYAFVILHAQEDFEEAVRLKSRLKSISSTIGATFAEDFEVPGQSTFRCVEDAIENSAYIMLLLTPNFNNRLNETNTDSALMNSIEKPHKWNTVIPLLPRNNGLSRNQMRPVLKTKIPLDETKDKEIFEKMVQKLLDSKQIQKQKLMWRMEQEKKKYQERQQWLLQERRFQMDLIKETTRVRELEEQIQKLKMQRQCLPPSNDHQSYPSQGFNESTQSSGHMPFPAPSSRPMYYSGNMCQQLPSNISIQNAKWIMVGNNSTMIVEGVDSSEEDSI